MLTICVAVYILFRQTPGVSKNEQRLAALARRGQIKLAPVDNLSPRRPKNRSLESSAGGLARQLIIA